MWAQTRAEWLAVWFFFFRHFFRAVKHGRKLRLTLANCWIHNILQTAAEMFKPPRPPGKREACLLFLRAEAINKFPFPPTLHLTSHFVVLSNQSRPDGPAKGKAKMAAELSVFALQFAAFKRDEKEEMLSAQSTKRGSDTGNMWRKIRFSLQWDEAVFLF